MPEKKMNGEATPPEAGGEATTTEKVTKIEAVHRVLEILGTDATPNQIQAEVKKQFDIDMTVDHAKTARNEILRRQAARDGVAGAAQKITKKEAVRRSLAKLGQNATPTAIQKDIKKRFGIEMNTNHISTTKGELRRAADKMKSPGKNLAEQAAQPQVQPAPVSATVGAAGSSKGGAVGMQDIVNLRALLDRVGAEQLRTLVDLMSR